MSSSDVLYSSSGARNESDTASGSGCGARLVAPPAAMERMPPPPPFAASAPASLAPLEAWKTSKTPRQRARRQCFHSQGKAGGVAFFFCLQALA